MAEDSRTPTIDERLDALTQSVELWVRISQERFSQIGTALGQVTESLNKLVRVAESHEHRLDSLEDSAG